MQVTSCYIWDNGCGRHGWMDGWMGGRKGFHEKGRKAGRQAYIGLGRLLSIGVQK